MATLAKFQDPPTHDGTASDRYLNEVIKAINTDSGDLKRLETLFKKCPMTAPLLLRLAPLLNRSNHQQDAANRKHSVNKVAKAYVLEYLAVNSWRFKTKIEFSRYAATNVLRLYKLDVKAETIARDWLPPWTDHEDTRPKPGAVAYTKGRYIVPKKKPALLHLKK